MKKKILILSLAVLLIGVFSGCTTKKNEDKTKKSEEKQAVAISAAASLTEALNEIQVAYAKESDTVLQFNFGGSGALQKQIQEGAPCDLFISASKKNMDTLEKEGLIESSTRKDLLGNTLTLIASKEKAETLSLESLTDPEFQSIALGEIETVPVGSYAKQSLESMGIWEEIQSKLIFAKDVKQVLDYVETGNADAGFVYTSDALLLKSGAVLVGDVPKEDHEPIMYPAALMKNTREKEAAEKFYQFLQGSEAKTIFEKYGFTVVL